MPTTPPPGSFVGCVDGAEACECRVAWIHCRPGRTARLPGPPRQQRLGPQRADRRDHAKGLGGLLGGGPDDAAGPAGDEVDWVQPAGSPPAPSLGVEADDGEIRSVGADPARWPILDFGKEVDVLRALRWLLS